MAEIFELSHQRKTAVACPLYSIDIASLALFLEVRFLGWRMMQPITRPLIPNVHQFVCSLWKPKRSVTVGSTCLDANQVSP